MTSKRSSSDPSTKKPPPPNPNPSTTPTKKKHKKKKRSKSHNQENHSPSHSTPKKMSPPMMASSPAASRKRKAREHDEADSLTILEAIIEFQSRNRGANPTPTNMMPLYESVKDTLHVDYTQDQLYNRIRQLRQKYYRQLDNPATAPAPAERAFYDLSLRAWGDSKKRTVATPTSNGAKPNPKAEKEKEKEKEKLAAAEEDDGIVGDEEMEDAENNGEAEDSFKYLNHQAKEYWRAMGLTAESLEMGLKSMDRVKAKLLEKKWVQHGDAGLKIQAKQSEIERDLFLALHATARKGTN
ncbi:uncharacterized protein M6B38_285720 [Iris pallida]|uniref:Glabrous enhancer-binding protein-like DBD domain-containing protein n=1 Tax=Iris pallida TaxID=29817 RepID=A0AAX6HXM7_IRIPA|nr:uncharacterized protein M6B38_285720 [Iris pallida]